MIGCLFSQYDIMCILYIMYLIAIYQFDFQHLAFSFKVDVLRTRFPEIDSQLRRYSNIDFFSSFGRLRFAYPSPPTSSLR